MPIYEYRCSACGHHLEALQKMSESPLRKCPECGKSQLKRLVSAPQFRLKGNGWYETDFKNDKERKRNLVETASAESSDSASEKSADTSAKPDTGEAKEDGGKAAAAAKSDPAPKPRRKPLVAKPAAARKPSIGKPVAVRKPSIGKHIAARKPAAKPRARAARG